MLLPPRTVPLSSPHLGYTTRDDGSLIASPGEGPGRCSFSGDYATDPRAGEQRCPGEAAGAGCPHGAGGNAGPGPVGDVVFGTGQQVACMSEVA